MATLPDFTISGDLTPLWSETCNGTTVDSSFQGFLVNSVTPSHSKSEVWVKDTTIKRHGANSIKVTGFRNSYGPSTSQNLDVNVILSKEGRSATQAILEGDDEWVGFSMRFPSNYAGSSSWCLLAEPFCSVHTSTHPSYGYGIECPNPAKFELTLKTGLLPSPPSGSYNPITPPNGNGYDVRETLLGTGGPRPFTKDVWHDFYYYCRYNATTDGILEIWHREEGGNWEKLYSNRNDGSALINRAPHPTMHWNTLNGVPGTGGTAGGKKQIYRVYRGTGAGDTDHDVSYWCDGWFRRQSEALVLAEFPASGGFSPPTISGFTPTSGIFGTSVVITGTNLAAATSVTFNNVAAVYTVNSSTQITAVVPIGATTGKVAVTTAGGGVTSSGDFTVTISQISFLGNYTDAVQINAAPLPPPPDINPPPSLDQFFGNYTDAVQIDSDPWTTAPVPPGHEAYGIWWREGRTFLAFCDSEIEAASMYTRFQRRFARNEQTTTLDVIGLPQLLEKP